MKVAIDTNILISAIVFPTDEMNRLIDHIARENTLVLTDKILNELEDVIERKFIHKTEAMKKFLDSVPYETSKTPAIIGDEFQIRDPNDYEILYSVLKSGAEAFITGDKDFEDCEIDDLTIMTPTHYSFNK